MKRMLMISTLLVATVVGSTNAVAGSSDAVVGAAVGGGAGALIGNSVNGRNGALVGGAIGALAGVAIATSDRDREVRQTVVYQQPVVRERVIVRQPPTVVVHRYEPRRVVVVDRHPGRGYGHGHWKRSYAYEDYDGDRGRGRGDRGDRWH
ncbi:MAG TPA: YMGG-like glycine zipper-containing protein [Moraxellaceae bacterium]